MIVSQVTGNDTVSSEKTIKIFTDVNTDHWAYTAINSLKILSYQPGRGDGSFGTDNSVTREEFVKMLLEFSERKRKMLIISSVMWMRISGMLHM